MICVLQRVSEASVTVDGSRIGQIDQGWLCLVGFASGDSAESISPKVDKILKLRAFEDSSGKMNLSVQDIDGGLLIVSQFTLLADLKKGNRPGFYEAAGPVLAEYLYNEFVKLTKSKWQKVQTGQFGSDMKVMLVNDGPVTFIV